MERSKENFYEARLLNNQEDEEVYEARLIKRHRSTKDQLRALDDQIVEALEGDYPQSVRHVFYLMTNPRLNTPVPKSDSGYQLVQRRCVHLRRSGRIPYGWITDATRYGYRFGTFDDAADFLRKKANEFRSDPWAFADVRCEVWVESRSIASVIHATCEEFAVPLYPSGGFTSLSLAHEAAEYINDADDGRPVVLFYIGDYDPAGVLIDKSIEKELREHLNDDIVLEFHRIAITAEQIEQYDLPTKPRKETDLRSREVARTVEAEAMPAKQLVGLLRKQLLQLLPARALLVASMQESEQRQLLEAMADMYERGEWQS